MDFKSKKNPVKREHIFFKSPTAAKQIKVVYRIFSSA